MDKVIKLDYSDKKNFYSFKDGAPIRDTEIQTYIDRVLENLIKDDNNRGYSFVGCGNTMIIGLKNEYEIEIIISRNHEIANIDIEKKYTVLRYDDEEDNE